MTMKQLMDLGAPPLPQGHFYRVRSNSFGQGFVQIRRKRWWGSILLADRLVPRWAQDNDGKSVEVPPEKGIPYAAQKALESVEADFQTANYWDAFRRLEGDHAHDWCTQ